MMKSFLLLSLISICCFSNTLLVAQQPSIELMATSGSGMPGQEVTIDIRVNNFTDIISCQASVNWDATLFRFKQIENFGIKFLDINDFGTSDQEIGHVRWVWTSDDAIALTIPDGTTLFTLIFEVISNHEVSGEISFEDVTSASPFPIEFANSAYEILNVNTVNGTITIESAPGEQVNITSIPNTSCDQRNFNGSLEATVNGETGKYIFQWFSGNETKPQPDYTGSKYEALPAGVYTLRILDEEQEVFLPAMNATVSEASTNSPDQIQEDLNNPQESCSADQEKQTGEIGITVNGEQTGNSYLITWWKGPIESGDELVDFENHFYADKLAAGNYEVMVENPATGCISYLSTVIEEQPDELNLSLSTENNTFCRNGANGSILAVVTGESDLNMRYYWFRQSDPVDTLNALAKGPELKNIQGGNYKLWAVDINSDCAVSGSAGIQNVPIYPSPEIFQRNDTIYANYSNSIWFLQGVLMNKTGPYLIPEKSGIYSISVVNEYNCQAFSEDLYFGITGLSDSHADISIFPNPFSEFVRVAHPHENIDFLRIYDFRGRLIGEFFDLKNKFTDLYLTGSHNGIYLIQVSIGGQIITRKVAQNLSK